MSQKPEIFGKYILLEKVAVGGMAEVYLAKLINAENIAKFVAIKRILPQHSRNQDFIEMFKEEAKIAIHLAHGNIVPIFEFGEEDTQFYLAMEFVEGRNLRQIVNRNKENKRHMGVDQCVYVINEAARGLDHAHRFIDGTTGRPLNIIHRDISPQNIMVSFDGGVKIVDFGIAKAESKVDSTRLGTLKGKFSYMSPEQADGQEVDFRTDIFSLGIVLWELLANERLFSANNEMNTLRKIRECQIPSLHKIDPKIPLELEKICFKALARDRNLRYQSAAEFHRDLNRFLNRQFPDFSSHDFSTSVKHLFAEEIIETRRRLVEYARITLESLRGENDPTMIVDATKTVTVTSTDTTRTNETATAPENLVNTGSGPKLETVSKTPLPVPKKLAIVPHKHHRTSRAPQLEQRAPKPTKKVDSEEESSSTLGLVGFISLLIICGALWLFKDEAPLSDWRCQYLHDGCKSSASAGDPIKTMATPEPGLQVVVQSDPPGAEIFIDGQTTSIFTPGKIRLPQKAETTLALRKDGYLTHSQKLSATKQGESIHVSLVRSDIGYISVIVRPVDAVIYINETELQEKPPIEKYAVPAQKRITVRAYDPVTGASAEKTVMVKANTNKDVSLFLNTKRK